MTKRKAEYFRWRPGSTWLAHLFKAVTKQHHRAMLPVLRRLIPTDGVVLDAGAHAGQFTKLFAGIARDGQVVAVEPGAYARSILRPALALNRVRNVVTVPVGLSDRSGVSILSVPIKRRGSHGFGLSHFGDDGSGRRIVQDVVATATLDDLASAMDLERLDFIKADVEGWEMRIVAGGESTIRRHRPALLLELNDHHLARAGDDLASAWATLGSLGYRPVEIRESDLVPLSEPATDDVLWLPEERGAELLASQPR